MKHINIMGKLQSGGAYSDHSATTGQLLLRALEDIICKPLR